VTSTGTIRVFGLLYSLPGTEKEQAQKGAGKRGAESLAFSLHGSLQFDRSSWSKSGR